MKSEPGLMDKIVSLSKRRGFIFQNSEIYGKLGSIWDYGPFGVELKRNIKNIWWQSIVHKREEICGLDAAILMHPKVWEASGHVQNFTDPFLTCPACSKHFRADRIWDEIWGSVWFTSLYKAMAGYKDSSYFLEWAKSEGKKLAPNLALVRYPEVTISWISELHTKFGGVDLDFKTFVGRIACSRDGVAKIPCPNCGNPLPEETTNAHLMLETKLGAVDETAERLYLRPETAQGIFVNFANILNTLHPKLPFGIAQIGKAFRNEITTGNFIFRTREFEQMEIEYFVKPEDSQKWHEYWINERYNWYLELGIKKDNLRIRPHQKDELAHYAKACSDIEYNFPFGWSELEGIAQRGDFDLKQHAKASGEDLTYYDDETKERYFPYIIEPSGGVDRTLLALLIEAYEEEKERVVMRFKPSLAPIKVGVFPLVNRENMPEVAREIYDLVKSHFKSFYDDSGSIGRRYRRQDEIGTPYCLTIDGQTRQDDTVTLRDRDTMAQIRIKKDAIISELGKRINI